MTFSKYFKKYLRIQNWLFEVKVLNFNVQKKCIKILLEPWNNGKFVALLLAIQISPDTFVSIYENFTKSSPVGFM